MKRPDEAPIFGLVLAGGLSTRFGSDKAAAQVGGLSLLEGAVQLLQSCLEEVWVSVRPDQASDALRSRFRCLFDRYPGQGPAAGLEAAHAQAPEHAWLALACDQPGLGGADLRRLIAERDATGGGHGVLRSANESPATVVRNLRTGYPCGLGASHSSGIGAIAARISCEPAAETDSIGNYEHQ